MSQFPDLTNENAGKDNFSGCKQPEVLLIGDKQWSYVQQKYNLTPRERQIAELVCQGFINGDIATVLQIAIGTVKTHIRNIYRKTCVNSKIAMLLKFVKDTEISGSHKQKTHPIPINELKNRVNITSVFSNTSENEK